MNAALNLQVPQAKEIVRYNYEKTTVGQTHRDSKTRKYKKNAAFKERRSQDKSRNRREDIVRENINKLLGIRSWRIMVDRREDWRMKLKEPRTLFGL